jgi:hypothetical protein
MKRPRSKNIKGRPLTPTKYRNEEESQNPWKRCTSVRSPYMPELLSLKTEFRDLTESYSEAFDLDDPTLMDRYTRYDTDSHLGDRSPIPIQQREVRFTLNANRKRQSTSLQSVVCPHYLLKVSWTLNTND